MITMEKDENQGPGVRDADHPLQSDPGQGHLFNVENNKFAFSPGQMGKLFNPKSLKAFEKLGGLDGLEKGLRTNRKAGLSSDEDRLDGPVSSEDATEHSSHANADESGQPNLAPHDIPRGDGHFSDRKCVFGINKLPEKKSKSI
jgi:P-type Ca2+ transporter type 2C